MDRRKFLIGMGGAAAGGSALLGTGAFSRVESQRDVTIQVAEDPDAYLGLSGTGSVNSENYVSIDDDGHLAIDISEHDDFDGPDTQPGEGVNSDSFTYFDSMVQVCNQGKQAAGFYIEEPTDDDFPDGIGAEDEDGNARLQFYTGEAAGTGDDGTTSIMGEDNAQVIPLGECIELGVRTVTRGVNATEQDRLFGDEVRLIADVDINPEFGDSPEQDPVVNTRTGETFANIQPAIDAAQESDRIQVLTGTSFDEDVTIDELGITLEATSNHKPLINGQVIVSTDGATLDGFEVSPPPAGGTSESEAIRVSNTPNDVTITNNTVVDFERNDPDGGFYGVDGINVFGGDGSTPIENVTVTNNEVRSLRNPDQAGVAGISIQGNVDGATVEGNDLSSLGEGVTSYGFGVTVRGTGNHAEVPENVEVTNNDISDVRSDDASDFLGVGLGVEADGSNYVFGNNDIDGAELGAEIKTAAGETSLSGNSFSGTDIHLGDLTGAVGLTDVLDDNDFDGAAATNDVVPNSLRPSGFDPYRQAIFPAIQPAIDVSESGARVDVGAGTYDDSITVDVTDLTLSSIQGSSTTTIAVDASTGRLEVSAPNVEISGFDIDLSDGEVVYVNPGEGLTFRNNVVGVSPSSNHGIRIDDSFGGPTVVEGNVFDIPSTDASVNSQAILFSGGEDYLIKNNVINGPGKGADSPDDANAGILASVQADTTDADIEDNEIGGFDQGVLLFENPPSANLDRFSITGNSISDADTGILAIELAGDGDTFSDINGESETGDQEAALESANTFAGSVDTRVDIQVNSS